MRKGNRRCSVCRSYAPCRLWKNHAMVAREASHVLQAGLNGVDNGQLWFDHVRVPRDALLDRYASVAEDGTYSSPIPSVAQRFGTMVGGLTTGASLPGTPCMCMRSLSLHLCLLLYIS